MYKRANGKANVGGSLTFGQARISTNKCPLTCAVHESKEDAESVHARDGLNANPAVHHDAECSHPNKECVYRSQDIVCQVTHYRPCRNTHCVHNKQQADSFNCCKPDYVASINVDLFTVSDNIVVRLVLKGATYIKETKV
jgi:hypothetical protein